MTPTTRTKRPAPRSTAFQTPRRPTSRLPTERAAANAASEQRIITKKSPVRQADGVGQAHRRRVGRILDRRNEEDDEEGGAGQKRGRGARPEGTDAAVGGGEDQREEAAYGSAVDDDARGEADRALYPSADQLLVAMVVVGFHGRMRVRSLGGMGMRLLGRVHLLLEGDGAIDQRLADDLGEDKGDKARDDTDEHAPYQERPDHDREPLS